MQCAGVGFGFGVGVGFDFGVGVACGSGVGVATGVGTGVAVATGVGCAVGIGATFVCVLVTGMDDTVEGVVDTVADVATPPPAMPGVAVIVAGVVVVPCTTEGVAIGELTCIDCCAGRKDRETNPVSRARRQIRASPIQIFLL